MSREIVPSCENCKHCHPIYDNVLVVKFARDRVFYCDHFESLYCEYEPCHSGYKKRRAKL